MFKYLYDLFMSFLAFLTGLCGGLSGGNKIEPESDESEELKSKEPKPTEQEVR